MFTLNQILATTKRKFNELLHSFNNECFFAIKRMFKTIHLILTHDKLLDSSVLYFQIYALDPHHELLNYKMKKVSVTGCYSRRVCRTPPRVFLERKKKSSVWILLKKLVYFENLILNFDDEMTVAKL